MQPRTLPAAVLLAFLLGCGPKSPPPGAVSGSSAGQAISAAAGGVAGDAAGAQITVPPGALPTDAHISLAQKAPETHASPGVLVVGSVWTFQVDGADHFTFTKPVTVAVPFDPALRKPGSSIGLSVWSGERWERVPGARLDAASSKVVAEVDHFSEYAPTQDSPLDRAKEDLLLNNEFWYGRIVVSIHAAGERRGELGGVETMSISREAEMTFRLKSVPGELSMVSVMDELKKHPGFALPPQAARAMEGVKGLRHWASEMVKPQPEDRTHVHLQVKDSYSGNFPKVELGELREEASSSQTTLDGTWNDDAVPTGHALEIDAKKGTYTFSLGNMSGGVMKYHHSGTGQREESSERPAGLSFLIKDRKLPDLRGTLDGSYAIPPSQLDFAFKGVQGSWNLKGAHVHGRVSWTFSPVPLDDVELVLAPAGYDDWLPRGGTSDGQKGDRALAIQARLQKRGGGATKARMQSLTVRLKDVSNVPGTCLNVPLEKGAETFDLQFAPKNGCTVDEEGTRVIKKGSEFDRLDLSLECYDWGAWGTLVGEAILVDGRILWATLDKDPSVEEILLPKRDSNSKVADKWKKEMNADGISDNDDFEPQTGNTHNGDGLTLYEEYRGMIAKGKHTRDYPAGPDGFRPLSPRRKDLIVCNTIHGEAAVVSGFRLLEKAAGIHVVEVDEKDLPESRLVNVNVRPELTAGPQHGLKLYKVSLGKGEVGATPCDFSRPAGSRERYERVQVDVDQIRSLYAAAGKLPWSVNDEISETVAHELAHGLDLDHHGTGRAVGLGNPSRLKIYNASKERITLTEVLDPATEPGNEAGGNVQCIMCYNMVYRWGYYAPELLFERTLTRPGSIFCTSKDGTGHNADFQIDDPDAPGRKRTIHGVFGKSVNGPCLPMMRIKDQGK
jgi:hypothetical protein